MTREEIFASMRAERCPKCEGIKTKGNPCDDCGFVYMDAIGDPDFYELYEPQPDGTFVRRVEMDIVGTKTTARIVIGRGDRQ